ncbi:MAG: 23S rRNA (pseudouridine(1915)-N(3))-methyltransferase RlmH, partial [Candidatus Dadabacteria bacterium]
TEEFAQFLAEKIVEYKQVVFLIGDDKGWDENIKTAFKNTLSLSKMTFSYNISEVVLIEQIYRAMALYHNHPYHK